MAVEAVMGLLDGTIAPIPQARKDGKQYFAMHERLKQIVGGRLLDRTKP